MKNTKEKMDKVSKTMADMGINKDSKSEYAYDTVIETCIGEATEILNEINNENFIKDSLPSIIQKLHNLTQYALSYNFAGCVRYSGIINDLEHVEMCFNHPLVKIILLYVNSFNPSEDLLYLDWEVHVYEERRMFKTREVFRLVHRLTKTNPYIQ